MIETTLNKLSIYVITIIYITVFAKIAIRNYQNWQTFAKIFANVCKIKIIFLKKMLTKILKIFC